MRWVGFRSSPTLLLIGLVCLALAGCGHKGRPLPLQQPLPIAPPDLQARQRGNSMLISWTIPDKNQNETPLTDLAGFNLYRMIFDPRDTCPECQDRSLLLQSIDLDYLVNAQLVEQRVYLADHGIRPGKGYFYRVTARTAAGHEGASAEVQREALPAPDAPLGLSAIGLDRLVRLEWQAVTPQSAAESLLGYQLYRGAADGRIEPAPVNSELLTSTGYDDFSVDNGQTYNYQIRSVIRRGDLTLESLPSVVVAATPQAGR